jgi:hypothetical protein
MQRKKKIPVRKGKGRKESASERNNDGRRRGRMNVAASIDMTRIAASQEQEVADRV